MEIKVGKTWVFGIFFNAIFSFNPFPIFQYFSWTLIFLFSPFTLIWQFPVDKLIHCEAWFSLLMPYSSERECQIFSCILYKTRYLSWQDIQSSRISSSPFPGFTWERWCKQWSLRPLVYRTWMISQSDPANNYSVNRVGRLLTTLCSSVFSEYISEIKVTKYKQITNKSFFVQPFGLTGYYCVSKKPWSISNSKLIYQIGQDFLHAQ